MMIQAGIPTPLDEPRVQSDGLRVSFVVGGFSGMASGVHRAVGGLANALGNLDTPVTIYTVGSQRSPVATELLAPPTQCVAEPGWLLGSLSCSPRLRRLLDRAIRDVDIVHNHHLWMLPTHYASMAAHRLSRPVVFSPHGTLKREAYASGRWKQLKKQAAWFCFQGRDMHRAACIHALTGEELKSIRAFGLRNPVCVIPNGVHLEDFTALPDRSAFDERFPATKGKRLCLSLSRLHRIKNLLNLVVAWSRIMKEHAEWHLVIAGPDGGLGQELRSLVNDLGIGWSITLAGPCYGTAKLAAFGAASLFVLPSFSEGFSATVLEAMACGLPMLLSSTCDFPESVAARAAIEVLPSAEEIERGLRLLLAMPEADRKEMGRRGQSLVRSRYQWKTIARQMRDVYAWVAGGGTPPISVDTGSC